MKSPFRLLSSLALAFVIGAPVAAKVVPPVGTVFDVPIACQIQQVKVLAITNTSGRVIPAGTRINYSYQRNPDHAVLSGYLQGGAIAPGQVIKRGIGPAYSCKAWFRRMPVLQPST
jgi:hypothetical protein